MTDTTENSIADKLKLVVALAFVVAGIAGYYWLAASSILLRILSVVAGVAAGVATAWMSGPGREFAVFAREAMIEVKKVVWPTRKETMQTTAAVFAFVVVMAVFLWVSDKTLEWALYDLILGWKRT
ncbi:MAG TPA: preprotein translocase subunit SecE [Burkholderiales bacterium]|jgi:preprotein translocase subunit SecE